MLTHQSHTNSIVQYATESVSYTHLDVYKRQRLDIAEGIFLTLQGKVLLSKKQFSVPNIFLKILIQLIQRFKY